MIKKIHLKIETDIDADIAGIVFSGNSYVLASLVNSALGIDMTRQDDLEIRNTKNEIDDSFPLYIFRDEELETDYILLQNRSKVFLLNEYKNINYIFMIRGEYRPTDFAFFINKISEISTVNFVVNIDLKNLHSKKYLVF